MTAVLSVPAGAAATAPAGHPAPAPYRCLHCGGPVAGLLADCDRPDCRRESIDHDAALDRLEDL